MHNQRFYCMELLSVPIHFVCPHVYLQYSPHPWMYRHGYVSRNLEHEGMSSWLHILQTEVEKTIIH